MWRPLNALSGRSGCLLDNGGMAAEGGHDVVTAKELGMEQAADEELLQEAKRLDRRLLTRDKDFWALVFLRRELSAGVILKYRNL